MFSSRTLCRKKIEILDLAAPELLGEYLPRLREVGEVVAGELVREIEGLAREGGERLADGDLALAAVVAPGGVEIVDAVLDAVFRHLGDGGEVDVVDGALGVGQAHAAHAEVGELHALEIAVYHMLPPKNSI